MSISKVPSLDSFHIQIEPLITLVQEYTEIEGLDTVIKICRLKPQAILRGKKLVKVELHKWWVDEYGNSLRILKNKTAKITLNDLTVNRAKLAVSDLYEGLPIQKISAMSKLAFLLVGKEGDNYQDHFVVSFLGLDNYLRTFCWIGGKWQMIPSLALGIKILKVLSTNLKVTWLKELPYKNPAVYPCLKQQMWITVWPNKDEISKSFSGNSALEKLIETMGI